MHQPAWLLWDTIKLAGIEPTTRGYAIDPLLPMRRLLPAPAASRPDAGAPARASGYVRALHGDRLRMVVRAPSRGRYRAFVGGRLVRSRQSAAGVVFGLPVRAGRVARWSLSPASPHSR